MKCKCTCYSLLQEIAVAIMTPIQRVVFGTLSIILASFVKEIPADCQASYTVVGSWTRRENGRFLFFLPVSSGPDGWTMSVTFNKTPRRLKVWNGINIRCQSNVCTFDNKAAWNAIQRQGALFSMGFQVQFYSG